MWPPLLLSNRTKSCLTSDALFSRLNELSDPFLIPPLNSRLPSPALVDLFSLEDLSTFCEALWPAFIFPFCTYPLYSNSESEIAPGFFWLLCPLVGKLFIIRCVSFVLLKLPAPQVSDPKPWSPTASLSVGIARLLSWKLAPLCEWFSLVRIFGPFLANCSITWSFWWELFFWPKTPFVLTSLLLLLLLSGFFFRL